MTSPHGKAQDTARGQWRCTLKSILKQPWGAGGRCWSANRTTLPIFPEHPHENPEAPTTQVANGGECRNIEISRKYRNGPIPQNTIARAGVHLLGPSQPKGTKNHTPGICKIPLTLIDSDQLKHHAICMPQAGFNPPFPAPTPVHY